MPTLNTKNIMHEVIQNNLNFQKFHAYIKQEVTATDLHSEILYGIINNIQHTRNKKGISSITEILLSDRQI